MKQDIRVKEALRHIKIREKPGLGLKILRNTKKVVRIQPSPMSLKMTIVLPRYLKKGFMLVLVLRMSLQILPTINLLFVILFSQLKKPTF